MRYQYSSQGFKKNFNGNRPLLPAGVKLLLIINVAVFILMGAGGRGLSEFQTMLYEIFSLSFFHSNEYRFWQIGTYLFVHADWLHIMFNMLALWLFGKDLELDWGKYDFLTLYFICGIGSGIITMFINTSPTIGASGAIYGILVAYGMLYPNRILLLYGIFPFKVKYIVLGFGLIAFLATLSSAPSSTSHITHLSGMIIGIIYILFNFKFKTIKLWYVKKRIQAIQNKVGGIKNDNASIKKQVDKILDKVNNEGWESLTINEEEFLTNASKRLFDDHSPN
mgnify:FL=1